MIIMGSARQRGTLSNAQSTWFRPVSLGSSMNSVGFPQFATGASKGIGSWGMPPICLPLSAPEKTPKFWAALCVAGALVPQEGPMRQCRADSL
jgi:hypothetical protein